MLASQEYEASIATTDHCCVINQDDDDNLECNIDDETFILATQQYERSELAATSQSQLSNVVAKDDDHIDQYLKDLECYEDMEEDDFKYDNLLMGVPRDGSESVQPHDDESVQPQDDESVQPQDDESVQLRDDESVQPKRFADPVSEKEILDMIKSAVPQSTKLSTTWSANIWQDWLEYRQSKGDEDVPPPLVGINNDQLGYWLPRFVLEVQNKKGSEYIGSTIYALCAGIQRFVREDRVASNKVTVDIFKDSNFAYFQSALNSKLIDLHSKGIGTTTKQAEVISNQLEEQLWEKKILGDDTPEKLLHTLVYLFGLHFALRSGREHRNIRPDMLKVIESDGSRPYLLYTESGLKNHSGGLNQRKVSNKVVKAFANIEDPTRYIVTLYKKYMALRPNGFASNAFYLQPLKQPRKDCWYQSKPIGHNPLSQVVKKLCDMVRAKGYYTNHSLHRTCAELAQQDCIKMEPMNSK